MSDIGKRVEYYLGQYADGLLSVDEFAEALRTVAAKSAPRPYAPSEATKLRHQARALRKSIAKAKALHRQRDKVRALMVELNDLAHETLTHSLT